MKKSIIIILTLICLCVNVMAGNGIKVRNHNLIFNGDIAFGNPYSAAIASMATGLANYHLLNNAFFENSFIYSVYSTDVDNLKVRTMNPMGITAQELFNNVQLGMKIGYQTYTPGFFNIGIYASGHYKLDQFKVGYSDDGMGYHRAQRLLVGATVLFSLGSMSQSSRVIIETGCRYSIGLNYKSPTSTDSDQLNNGIVSHFAIKLANRGMMQNIGLFADINHFDMWKDSGKKLKNYTFGITWTITPQQVDDRF